MSICGFNLCNNNPSDPSGRPDDYISQPGIRLLGIVTLVILIATVVFFSCTTPSVFCEKFLNWFHQINWMHAAIGLEVTLFLSGGTALVFHHVMTTKNAITGQEIGALSGDTHWESIVVYESSRQEIAKTATHPGNRGKEGSKKARYIDTSTLTEKQSGVAFGYASFHADSLYKNMTSIGNGTISLLTLPTMIGTIVFHIFRAVLIPFYIGACMAIEYCQKEPLFEARSHGDKPKFFKVEDIFLESGSSIFHVIKAPFFATAFLLANLYCLLDPLNGNKLAAAVEQEWNDGISLSEGFWSKEGPQGNWKESTRAAGPDGLGTNPFYLGGCMQPNSVFHYENGKIVKAYSLNKAVTLHLKRGELIYKEKSTSSSYTTVIDSTGRIELEPLIIMDNPYNVHIADK